jgi:hypothetical protein
MGKDADLEEAEEERFREEVGKFQLVQVPLDLVCLLDGHGGHGFPRRESARYLVAAAVA